MDPFSRLEKQKDPNYSMHCYDCCKGLDFDSAEYYRSRTYCKNCFCDSCKKPFDRARRIKVTHNKTKHTVTICPKCLCCKCKKPIVNIPFITTNKGNRCCTLCSCQVCNAAVCVKNVTGKRHCQNCICQGCSGSLIDGFSMENDLKYCNKCKGKPNKSSISNIPVETCALCKRDLGNGTVLTFNDKQYHDTCFTCFSCKKSFGHEQVFIKDNNNYCTLCISGSCNRCLKAIGSAPALEVGGKKYHENCFSCSSCGKLLPDGICSLVNNQPYCNDCGSRKDSNTQPNFNNQQSTGNCGKCNGSLSLGNSIGIAELSKKYHKQCFNCIHCNKSLAATGCRVFVNSDKPYCQECMQVLSKS